MISKMTVRSQNQITKHFVITPFTTYLEFLLPDGRYCYYEFEPNHKIREKLIWQF